MSVVPADTVCPFVVPGVMLDTIKKQDNVFPVDAPALISNDDVNALKLMS